MGMKTGNSKLETRGARKGAKTAKVDRFVIYHTKSRMNLIVTCLSRDINRRTGDGYLAPAYNFVVCWGEKSASMMTRALADAMAATYIEMTGDTDIEVQEVL